jgi:hypothetical protein
LKAIYSVQKWKSSCPGWAFLRKSLLICILLDNSNLNISSEGTLVKEFTPPVYALFLTVGIHDVTNRIELVLYPWLECFDLSDEQTQLICVHETVGGIFMTATL